MNQKKHLDKVESLGAYMRSNQLYEALSNPSEESEKFINEQVLDIINKQEACGLKAITDGEFRFKSWDYGFFFGFKGVENVRIEYGNVYQDSETLTDVLNLNGRIEFNPEHPVFSNFQFLRDNLPANTQAAPDEDIDNDENFGNGLYARVSMPSPALFFFVLLRQPESYSSIYQDIDILADDIILAYRKTIKALHAAGCTSVKFDDPTWGFIYDQYYLKRILYAGLDLRDVLAKLVRINTEALSNMPADLQRIMFVCRHSHSHIWTAEPNYSEFAKFAFDNPNADAFFVDCDLDSDFAFLDEIDKSVDVCLGLSDPWSPALVEVDAIKDCVARASEKFPFEKLSISPRSGFLSLPDNTNAFEPSDQWRKIEHLQDVAKQIWK